MSTGKSKRRLPNPNLWSIGYTSDLDPAGGERLWICAPRADLAAAKARTVLGKLGHRKIVVTRLKHEGTIDAF